MAWLSAEKPVDCIERMQQFALRNGRVRAGSAGATQNSSDLPSGLRGKKIDVQLHPQRHDAHHNKKMGKQKLSKPITTRMHSAW